ncbi:MAG: glycogen synthase GlgA [Tissierellia bacterium]|nr:glycogen synthase GlgA [Tissierellia bacterium]
MNIFFIASESTPYIKTGGLADVMGSLPKSIGKLGHDVSVVLPLYSQIGEEYRKDFDFIGYYYVDLDWRRQYVGVYTTKLDGVQFYFLDNEYYFKRYSIYGQEDDGERFAYFNKATVQLLKYLNIKPDIVHANDWHTGLVPLYIKDFARGDSFYNGIKTVFTIHNIKYQGVFPADMLKLTGLSVEYFHEDGLKFYDCINMMKAGIVYSDRLTTVSKTYAQEIMFPYFGEGLDGIIRKHRYKLSGIINGIDYEKYNSKTDDKIASNYDVNTVEIKTENKLKMQEMFGLPVNKDIPVFAMVSRLVDLKGIDLLTFILDEILAEDIQLVVLGTGDKKYEEIFKDYEYRYPDKMAARIYFNEAHSHIIYSGADILLMPSLAEPCGISQLISMRYGTVPLVRETGGLKDTVIPYNKYTGEGTGFGFSNINAHELLFAIRKAIEVYNDKDKFKELVHRDMMQDNSWTVSSNEYISLYENIY